MNVALTGQNVSTVLCKMVDTMNGLNLVVYREGLLSVVVTTSHNIVELLSAAMSNCTQAFYPH